MESWNLLGLLPFLRVSEPIHSRIASLVSPDDWRLEATYRAHPGLRRQFAAFAHRSGKWNAPGLIVVRETAPAAAFSRPAIESFRDLVALSVVPQGCAYAMLESQWRMADDAAAFALYPWSPDPAFRHIAGAVPPMLALKRIPKMPRRRRDEYFYWSLLNQRIDFSAVDPLLQLWNRRYSGRRPDWRTRALFDSLARAHAAMRPAPRPKARAAKPDPADRARRVALWVRAFEALVPPPRWREGPAPVYDLLETIKMRDREPWPRYYRVHRGRAGHVLRNLPCWIYGEMKRIAEDVAAGNPVAASRLAVAGTAFDLAHFAPPLYRLALTAFVPIVVDADRPVDTDSIIALFVRSIVSGATQINYERAIRKAEGAAEDAIVRG